MKRALHLERILPSTTRTGLEPRSPTRPRGGLVLAGIVFATTVRGGQRAPADDSASRRPDGPSGALGVEG